MAYVDDWYATPADERKRLEEPCHRLPCTQLRYQHGTVRITGEGSKRVIVHEPGPCTGCRCKVFMPEDAITRDAVLDLADWLATKNTLADLGVQDLGICSTRVMRFLDTGNWVGVCVAPRHHEGDHDIVDWRKAE